MSDPPLFVPYPVRAETVGFAIFGDAVRIPLRRARLEMAVQLTEKREDADVSVVAAYCDKLYEAYKQPLISAGPDDTFTWVTSVFDKNTRFTESDAHIHFELACTCISVALLLILNERFDEAALYLERLATIQEATVIAPLGRAKVETRNLAATSDIVRELEQRFEIGRLSDKKPSVLGRSLHSLCVHVGNVMHCLSQVNLSDDDATRMIYLQRALEELERTFFFFPTQKKLRTHHAKLSAHLYDYVVIYLFDTEDPALGWAVLNQAVDCAVAANLIPLVEKLRDCQDKYQWLGINSKARPQVVFSWNLAGASVEADEGEPPVVISGFARPEVPLECSLPCCEDTSIRAPDTLE